MNASDPLSRLGPRPNVAVIRDDVRAIEAYAVPSAVGFVKLDAMENPFALPEADLADVDAIAPAYIMPRPPLTPIVSPVT